MRIATLINKLVDMDGWDEDQEQELFELSVSACLEVICKGLAPPHYDMLHTPRGPSVLTSACRRLPKRRPRLLNAWSRYRAEGCSARSPWPS